MLDDPYAVIVSQDEVHFQLQTSVTRMWCPVGVTPIVGSAPGRDTLPYSGFVILGKYNGHLFITKPEGGRFNYLTTIESIRSFLKAYPMPDECKLYLIMDNAPWHKKARRLILEDEGGEYLDIREKVNFLEIPPYSPDLNPIEQVWRKTRREVTHNKYFPRLPILENELDCYFRKFTRNNDELASLCTFDFNKANKSPKRAVRVRINVGTFHAMKISSKHKKCTCTALVPYAPLLPWAK